MTTNFLITLAENGYIVDTNDGEFLTVYQGGDIPAELSEELTAELHDLIEEGAAARFKVTVTVEPADP